MGTCCTNCFADKFIVDFIKNLGQRGACEYCDVKHRRWTADTATVGEFVREGLARAYITVTDDPMAWLPDEHCSSGGTCATDVLLQEVDAFSDRLQNSGMAEELAKDLLQDSDNSTYPEDCDWLEGGSAELVRNDRWDEAQWTTEFVTWERFKKLTAHHSRFFDFGQVGREEQLRLVESALVNGTGYLDSGTDLVRARVRDNNWSISADAIGPPPYELAMAGRMNPVGIPYFYAAKNQETAIAELRPAVGAQVVLGRFVTRRKIRVLDLSRSPQVDFDSIFDSQYRPGRHLLREFLDDFVSEISRPLVPAESNLGYVATQILTEYFRRKGFQGLLYRSAQDSMGQNIVLFCGPRMRHKRFATSSQDIMLPSWQKWLNLTGTTLVQITAAKYSFADVPPA